MNEPGPFDIRRFGNIAVDVSQIRAISVDNQAKILFHDGVEFVTDATESAKKLLDHFGDGTK